MRRPILLILLVVATFVASCRDKSSPPPADLPGASAAEEALPGYDLWRLEGFRRTFKGRLEGMFPITMQLEQENGALTGSYQYDGKVGAAYQLTGTVQESGAFQLVEKDAKGQLRSSFDGYFHDRQVMEGHWSAAEGGAPIPFRLESWKDAAVSSITVDSVVPEVLVHHRAVRYSHCDCWVYAAYPQIQGLAAPEAQEEINREVRWRVMSSLQEVEAVQDTNVAAVQFGYQTTYHSAGMVSGVSRDHMGQVAAAWAMDLNAGRLLSTDDLLRDRKGLEAHLASQKDGFGAITHCWLSAEGMHVADAQHREALVAWRDPQLAAWFRNLPPTL